MPKVTTSIVVSFTRGDSGGHLSAEIDARPDGYNHGVTNFTPGAQPAFLIYKSNDVTIDQIRVSAGEVIDIATGTYEVTELLNFIDSDEAAPSKAVYGSLVSKWLGNDLGAVSVVGDSKLKAATKGVGVLKVTYLTQYIAKRLVNVPDPLNGESEYNVVILIEGHTD